MARLQAAPRLVVLTIGLLTAACAVGVEPSESGSPTPVAPTSPVASPTPPANPSTSSTPGPVFAAARIPKAATLGVPPDHAPVVFDEVGLPVGQMVHYVLTGNASASYQCWNPKTAGMGGPHTTVTGRVTADATLKAGADGAIRSTLQLRLPPPISFSCSTGSHAVAYAGRYDQVLLVDATNDLPVELGTYQFVAN
jgi:hypothetical protein